MRAKKSWIFQRDFPEPGGVGEAVISICSSSFLRLAGVSVLSTNYMQLEGRNMKNIQNT